MELAALEEAVDRLVDCDPASLGDADSVLCLLRQVQRLEAVTTGAVGAFEASGDWKESGARTAASFLAVRSRLPQKRCASRVGRARRLADLPRTKEAWRGGELSVDHVDCLLAARNRRTCQVFDRDEEVLVGMATSLRFDQFLAALRHWEYLADPDGTEEGAERRRCRRDVQLVQGFSGEWFGRIHLDPVTGAIVTGELARIEQALFEADWAEARERLVAAGETREPTVDDLARTGAERRAAALGEMAIRSAACPDGARRPAPLFTVLVGYETLHGRMVELANGTVVTPGSLLRYLEGADIERAVFSGDGRVEVGPTHRFFTGALRRALELRDRECAHHYCQERYERCQADHIHEFSKGGTTTQENGRMLCPFHNRLRNQRRRE
jgi:Domain of unknown function (DUF222)